MELLNDEEVYIQIEAIELITEIVTFLEPEVIENEFLQAIFNTIDADIEEITLRIA